LPKEYTAILGETSGERINNMIHDIVRNSANINDIKMSEDIENAMKNLRKYMFQNVYIGSKAKDNEKQAQNLIKQLFLHFTEKADSLPSEYINMIERGEDKERVVCDYVAGMTDRYAINKFYKIFIPSSWKEL
jgi:dGTPase